MCIFVNLIWRGSVKLIKIFLHNKINKLSKDIGLNKEESKFS